MFRYTLGWCRHHQFRVYTKTLNKQKAEGKERKSGSRRAAEEKEKEPKNGEHTIRPVALVGGVGVRLRRFCFIIIKIVVVIVYYVVEEVSLFEEYDKKREGYVRR